MTGSVRNFGTHNRRAANGGTVREGFVFCLNGAEYIKKRFKVVLPSSVIGILGGFCA